MPRLPPYIKLHFDQVRKCWVLLAPERVLMPDEIALDVLQRCDGVATVGVISAALAEKYAAARDEVTRDVIEMLQELLAKGVVVA